MGEETGNVTRGVVKSRAMVFLSFAMAVRSAAPAVAQYDVLIRGGRVLDGLGNPVSHPWGKAFRTLAFTERSPGR